MRREHRYYVYMLTNVSQRPFYTGVTNNPRRRLLQHRDPDNDDYTQRYRLFRLVYLETFRDIRYAIAWEKKLKKLPRAKKIALVRRQNPRFDDLSRDWFKT